MDLFYAGLFAWIIAVVGAIANFATIELKDIRSTTIIHLLCGLVGAAGTVCVVIWVAQLLYAAAT